MPRFWNFSLVFLRPDDSPVFCVGNFVISRLCKLFFSRLARERTSESSRKRAKSFIFSRCYYTESSSSQDFFASLFEVGCMSHFSQESYFWKWTLGGKLAAFRSSVDSGKVSPWKVVGLPGWLQVPGWTRWFLCGKQALCGDEQQIIKESTPKLQFFWQIHWTQKAPPNK